MDYHTHLLLLLLLGAMSVQAARISSSSVSSMGHPRSLLTAGYPMPLPAPFDSPATIAGSATAARASSSSLALGMCTEFARSDIQGSREFRDINGVKLWPMFINMGRAAAVYPDTAGVLGEVLAKCNAMGGMAAEGAGYGVAFIYAKGVTEATGLTAMLESAYDKSGGCSAVNNIMDVAAAVIKSRDVALDELHLAMKTWSPKLAACTPKDDQQRFRAYNLKGDVSVVKPRGSRSVAPSAADANMMGAGGPGAVTDERGPTAAPAAPAAPAAAAAGGNMGGSAASSSSNSAASVAGGGGGSSGRGNNAGIAWEMAHGKLGG